jgi:hypothetical protein
MPIKLNVWIIVFLSVCIIVLVVYLVTKPPCPICTPPCNGNFICEKGSDGFNCMFRSKTELYKYGPLDISINTITPNGGFNRDLKIYDGLIASGPLLSSVEEGDTIKIADTSNSIDYSYVISGITKPSKVFPYTSFKLSPSQVMNIVFGGSYNITLSKKI